MNTKSSNPKRILVQLDLRHSAGRSVASGILRYAATHVDWDLQLLGGHPANEPIRDYLSWRPVGLITDQPLDRAAIRKLRDNGLRAVASFHREETADLGVPVIHAECDHRLVARTAVQLLLRKGLTHFAYVPAPVDDPELAERERVFCRFLKDRGFEVAVYRRRPGGSTQWLDELTALSAWLKTLPKPCGLLAVFDQRAKHVLDACRLSGIAVPEQVQVVGIDNEEFICEQTVPPLTSVMPDFEGLGYRVAARLYLTLRQTRGKSVLLKAGIRGIVERLSTSDFRGAARCVALAREFIRRHAASGIRVADVVSVAHTSERLLQRHFRSICGHSVRDELIETRLALVKERLLATHIPIDRIGDFCGFRDVKNLKALFRRRFGQTMSDYRRTAGA